MENKLLSRQNLESMSTSDLISIADDYGIDIPDNLNRRFIIAELLEAADESENTKKADSNVVIKENSEPIPEVLPTTYNETQICAILRNPAWVFVFWDIKESELSKLKNEYFSIQLFLHVTFYETEEKEKSVDTFDIKIKDEDREQYILLPAGKKYFTIELLCTTDTETQQILASTRCIAIPSGCEALTKMQPGKDVKMNALVKLSGMEKLLHDHFNNYRQSF